MTMGSYNNKGLVQHAKKALSLKTKYMWGGILRPIEKQYDMLQRIYGNQSGTGYTAQRWGELKQLFGKGYYGVDCVGLIKSYYWSGKVNGGVGSPKYGAAGFPDVNASYMYQQAKIKGKISDMPDIPGLIVFCKSSPHVGIYIGNGETIESTYGSRGDGVVKHKLDKSFWTDWFECPYISYEKEITKTVVLAYPAQIRDRASDKGRAISILNAGIKCVIISGSKKKDADSNYEYVKLAGGKEQWIVASAIKGGAN